MKKTRSTITILLVLGVLILGIGYALTATELKINGTLGAKADDSNFKVKFTAARANEADVASTTIEPVATATKTSDLLATFTVKDFTCAGDKVVLEYDVTNESEDLNADVTAAVKATFGNKEYFDVKASFAAATETTTTTISAGATSTLYVTVTCIKTPTADVADATTEGIITLTATAAEA